MSWRLFSFGVALAACIHAYLNPESSIFPRTATEAQLKLRDFWHRTWFLHQASPYVLSEQTHIVQHPPPKDALTPAQRKALEEQEEGQDAPITTFPVGRMPAYFISHGTKDTRFHPESLPYKSWQALGVEIVQQRPKAIVVVSSQWKGPEYRILVNDDVNNNLIYDTDATEKPTFTSKSDTQLTERIIALYGQKRLVALTESHGLDSGVWNPFRVMFNGTLNIPVVQVSLQKTGSPTEALQLGQAIAALRDEGVMFIGTGMAAHNPKVTEKYSAENPAPWIDDWLEILRKTVEDHSGDRREIRSKQITFSSNYRNVHPTTQYLFPLHFIIGAAGEDEGQVIFTMVDGASAWGHYRFGTPDQEM